MPPKRMHKSSSLQRNIRRRDLKKQKKDNVQVRYELKRFLKKYNFPISVLDNDHDVKEWLTKKDSNGNFPLFIGCQIEDQIQLSLKMIEIYPDALNQPGWSGNKNPFHLVCAKGNINLIIQLLKINSRLVNETDCNGRSPLFYACKYQRLDVIRYLLKNTDIDINTKDLRNQTVFHYSCDLCMFDSCTELLNHEMLKYEEIDNDGNTPLFSIIISMIHSKNLFNYKNSIEVIKKLLQKCKTSIKYCTNDGCNILHKITRNFHVDIKLCKLYWEFIVSINSSLINNIDKDNGLTPIHYACIFINDFPSFLLKSSMIITRNYIPCVMINKQDNCGQTAFYHCCKMHKYSAFSEILNYEGTNIEIADKFGNTVLHAVVDEMPSVSRYSSMMIKKILEKCPFMIIKKNKNEKTAIDMVCLHVQYAKELVAFGNNTAKCDLVILMEILQIMQDYLLKARNVIFDYILSNNNEFLN